MGLGCYLWDSTKTGGDTLTQIILITGAPITAHQCVPGVSYRGRVASGGPDQSAAARTSAQTMDHLMGRLADGGLYVLSPDSDAPAERDKRRIGGALGDIPERRPALSPWHPDHADAVAAVDQT